MTGTAIATMVLICGIVWGGFALLLTRAVRRESGKRRGTGGGVGDPLAGTSAVRAEDGESSR